MTGAEIIDEICGPLSYDPDNSDHETLALRWANLAQLNMAGMDWEELITTNATFTTDGSEQYDLTSEIDETFFRIRGDSVRIGTRLMQLTPKAYIDAVDPSNPRTWGSTAYRCGIINKTTFWLWPVQSSGETVTLDWVKKPTDITADTAEASISYDPDRHDLITTGGLIYGYTRHPELGMNVDKMRMAYDDLLRKRLTHASRVKVTTGRLIPAKF